MKELYSARGDSINSLNSLLVALKGKFESWTGNLSPQFPQFRQKIKKLIRFPPIGEDEILLAPFSEFKVVNIIEKDKTIYKLIIIELK